MFEFETFELWSIIWEFWGLVFEFEAPRCGALFGIPETGCLIFGIGVSGDVYLSEVFGAFDLEH